MRLALPCSEPSTKLPEIGDAKNNNNDDNKHSRRRKNRNPETKLQTQQQTSRGNQDPTQATRRKTLPTPDDELFRVLRSGTRGRTHKGTPKARKFRATQSIGSRQILSLSLSRCFGTGFARCCEFFFTILLTNLQKLQGFRSGFMLRAQERPLS